MIYEHILAKINEIWDENELVDIEHTRKWIYFNLCLN